MIPSSLSSYLMYEQHHNTLGEIDIKRGSRRDHIKWRENNMTSTGTMDLTMLFIRKLNPDRLFHALWKVRKKIGVFDGTSISKYLNVYYDEIEISGWNRNVLWMI